jgi:hypothetical protein
MGATLYPYRYRTHFIDLRPSVALSVHEIALGWPTEPLERAGDPEIMAYARIWQAMTRPSFVTTHQEYVATP